MITEQVFRKMRENFGKVSSWAVWADVISTPKSGTGDLSVFESRDLLKTLNPDYVFVGLNISGGGNMDDAPDWGNFHSDYRTHNDYKLRYALKGTRFWGAYMTDIIKKHADPDGGEVMRYLKDHPDVIKENIESFRKEIACLGTKPALIAMGGKPYGILSSSLGGEFKIMHITHYSYTISKEDYRKRILEELGFNEGV
ncbi:MAG: hypothetical protein K6F35_01570 [Lachnospiraceae bacterium]|nr:hypothetical protein [Lachnospiraceae bacterium]